MEIQDSRLGTLMQSGDSGGEIVQKDDLWQCLFGNVKQRGESRLTNAEKDVDRFLRGEAAERRASGQ
ncbi:unnamed protein product [Penicillium salamii]|nr:unnamed protein product [Penicillium salamii]CAG8128739.1 unnamed protein product [Penicillium salamii]CAG8198081.1 unnamed protein product [Penicillium salamii]CAG8210483.1 unnamed protein product [Penicillium salamii]CAG8258091.1 unnamed protein product [Penicillium salamii]